MTDWADEKAREWLDWLASEYGNNPGYFISDPPVEVASLAALLREVEDECAISGTMSDWVAKRKAVWRGETLAEVRRVVKGVQYSEDGATDGWQDCCSEILARLEKL
jgi:hypothetical protein